MTPSNYSRAFHWECRGSHWPEVGEVQVSDNRGAGMMMRYQSWSRPHWKQRGGHPLTQVSAIHWRDLSPAVTLFLTRMPWSSTMAREALSWWNGTLFTRVQLIKHGWCFSFIVQIGRGYAAAAHSGPQGCNALGAQPPSAAIWGEIHTRETLTCALFNYQCLLQCLQCPQLWFQLIASFVIITALRGCAQLFLKMLHRGMMPPLWRHPHRGHQPLVTASLIILIRILNWTPGNSRCLSENSEHRKAIFRGTEHQNSVFFFYMVRTGTHILHTPTAI